MKRVQQPTKIWLLKRCAFQQVWSKIWANN